jgi:hypothetical protein
MWPDESLTCSKKNQLLFGQCCLQGTIDLPPLHDMPKEVFDYISADCADGLHFKSGIRLYNSTLAFTSSSAKVDESLMAATTGTYTYRINGAIHHSISSYLPNPNYKPKFSQIYVYDHDMQITIRAGMFPKAIKASILNTIQRLLELNNPYVKIYMQAGE